MKHKKYILFQMLILSDGAYRLFSFFQPITFKSVMQQKQGTADKPFFEKKVFDGRNAVKYRFLFFFRPTLVFCFYRSGVGFLYIP